MVLFAYVGNLFVAFTTYIAIKTTKHILCKNTFRISIHLLAKILKTLCVVSTCRFLNIKKYYIFAYNNCFVFSIHNFRIKLLKVIYNKKKFVRFLYITIVKI